MSHFQNPAAWQIAIDRIQEALDTQATHLSLSHLRLRSLPPEFQELAPQLLSLDLSWCKQLKEVPLLEYCRQLKTLDLSCCDALTSLNGIQGLTQLQILTFSCCDSLTSLDEIQTLTQLQTLDLSFCHSLTTLDGMQALTQLRTLTLSGCLSLTSLDEIQTLTQLQTLDLSYCNSLASLDVIQTLTQLQTLGLSSCNSLATLDGMQTLTQLQTLDLSYCNSLASLNEIQTLPQLHTLDISYCDSLASLYGIQTLTQLQTLDLSYCKSLISLDEIQALTRLQSLDISGCNALTSLGGIQALTQLRTLAFSYCDSLTSLDGIQALTQLRTLTFSDCNSLTSLDGVQALTQLRTLTFSDCDSSTSLVEIQTLAQLQTLDLSFCKSLTSLDEIKTLAQLQTLDLTHCKSLTSLDGIQALAQLQSLKISGCNALTSLDGIQALTQLQSLEISGCNALTSFEGIQALTQLKTLELVPFISLNLLDEIQALTQLQTLCLTGCNSLSSLDGIQALTQLKTLFLSNCHSLISIDEIQALTQLHWFSLGNCDSLHSVSEETKIQLLFSFPHMLNFGWTSVATLPNVPKEITDESSFLPLLEDWYHEVQQGFLAPNELKIMVLGNGRIGKTQLVRRLRGLAFDEGIPSTHGIQLAHWEQAISDEQQAQIQSWDFGGQDVYLGTHSLFIDSRALYILLWHPDYENTDLVEQDGLAIRNRPLSYWLSYLHSLAGSEAQILVLQSQCDDARSEQKAPIPMPQPFSYMKESHVSAKMADGLDCLNPLIKRAIKLQLDRNGEIHLPISWMKVADRLRERHAEKKISYQDYLALCQDSHVTASDTLLHYLHQAGKVFFKAGHFDNQIILDQAWALQGVYLLTERTHVLPLLQKAKGHFSKDMLDAILWKNDTNYSDSERQLFLEMMQQCGICFEIAPNSYIAADCLPDRAECRLEIERDWRDAPVQIQVRLNYKFLHDSTMRYLLSRIGEKAKAIATYWRYGCCYYDAEHKTTVMMDCCIEEAESNWENYTQPGHIDLQLNGLHAAKIAEHLIRSILETNHLGQKPEVNWLIGQPENPACETTLEKDNLSKAFEKISEGAVKPMSKNTVYFSYAWGDENDLHQQISDATYKELQEIATVVRDREATQLGDSIEEFERKIGGAPYIVVILSEKYLKSEHCMHELSLIYQHSLKHRENFLQRVIPLVLQSIRIDNSIDRLDYVEYWQEKHASLNAKIEKLGAEAVGTAALHDLRKMRDFMSSVADVLFWISDMIMQRDADSQAKAAMELLIRRIQEQSKPRGNQDDS